AVIAWLKDNLERPVQMLSTGCSAGGAGSLSNYAHLRRDMAPDHGFLLNDSGPLFPAGPEGSGLPNLSYPLHTLVRARWGLDEDTMEGISPMQWLASQLPDFDSTNLGSLYQGLSGRYADDRLGHTHFWQDYNYSRYSYESFYPEIYAAETPALAEERTRALWYSDTKSLAMELALLDNFGVYLPNFRALNASHCSTIVDFRNGDIQEAGLELQDFIDNLLDGSGPVINAVEREWSADPAKPVPLLYRVVDKILSDAMSSTP
ncbi:MAG: hypothetical protein KDK91_17625, partial [Gammaproteobacteria bacterium]|nr:hypothetical protein [Gammaproteobacteria bacterium]